MSKDDIIIKNSCVFEKKSDKYFVLMDNLRHTLFCFKKDTGVIWKYIDGKLTLNMLYDRLLSDGFNLSFDNLKSTVVTFARCGFLVYGGLFADVEFIKENNSLNVYIDECTELSKPTTVILEVTDNCNLSCVHCYNDTKSKKLSLEEIKTLFEGLKNTMVLMVTLTGGEITTYDQWRKIIKLAHDNGLIVSVISNFTLFTDDDADFLINAHLYSLQTSIYSIYPEIHDKITGVAGSCEKTLNRIKYFLDRGQKVDVNCELMEINYKSALETQMYLKSIGADIGFDFRIHPSRNNKKTNDDLILSKSAYKDLYDLKVVSSSVRSFCGACKNRVRINQEGNVMPCEFLNIPLGNIKEQDIYDILNSANYEEIAGRIDKYEPEKCKGCDFAEICARCPAFEWNVRPFSNTASERNCYYTEIATL